MDEPHTPEEPRFDEATGQYTTGHSWDGIEELNTPMPRWWLGIFYASIVIAIIYAILMPSIPLVNGYYQGVLGKSDRAAVAAEMDQLRADRADLSGKLVGSSLSDIEADPELFRFAMAAGKSAFGDNCATCHGAGGQGFIGYPNLNDDVWLWGGGFDDIRETITVGIRSGHEYTRTNLMSAYGRDGFLDRAQISELVDYISAYQPHELDADHPIDPASIENGRATFLENCASCHGKDAKGDQNQGAPNLTDNEWLYGGSSQQIFETLWGGRQGVMPNWNERLDEATLIALSVYVYELGGGQPDAEGASSVPAEDGLEGP